MNCETGPTTGGPQGKDEPATGSAGTGTNSDRVRNAVSNVGTGRLHKHGDQPSADFTNVELTKYTETGFVAGFASMENQSSQRRERRQSKHRARKAQRYFNQGMLITKRTLYWLGVVWLGTLLVVGAAAALLF